METPPVESHVLLDGSWALEDPGMGGTYNAVGAYLVLRDMDIPSDDIEKLYGRHVSPDKHLYVAAAS